MRDEFALITTFKKVVVGEYFERVAPKKYERRDLMLTQIKSKYDASAVARMSDRIRHKYPGIFIWSRDRNQVVYDGGE